MVVAIKTGILSQNLFDFFLFIFLFFKQFYKREIENWTETKKMAIKNQEFNLSVVLQKFTKLTFILLIGLKKTCLDGVI